MSDPHRSVTHNPVVALARALRRQAHVRILLRSFTETLPTETIEGWVQRFEGDTSEPTRVVVSATRESGPEMAERIIRIDRVALVEEIDDQSKGSMIQSSERETIPAPAERPANPDATVKLGAIRLTRRES